MDLSASCERSELGGGFELLEFEGAASKECVEPRVVGGWAEKRRRVGEVVAVGGAGEGPVVERAASQGLSVHTLLTESLSASLTGGRVSSPTIHRHERHAAR